MHVLLGSIVALGLFAYIPGVWLSVGVGAWGAVVVDTLVYGAGIVAFARRDLAYGVRAGVLIGAAYLLGALHVFLFGPVSAGPLWLCAVPVLTAVLFERRETLWALALTAGTLAVAGLLVGMGRLAWGPWPSQIALFILIAGNLLVISAGLALAVNTLIHGMRRSAERSESLTRERERERVLLEEANRRLQREIAERAEAETRLRRSEKLTALGTLAGGIAHNLNNLLLPMLMGVEMLRQEEDERARDELLDQMAGAGRGARDVVRQMLTFARALPEAGATTDAAPAFHDALRLLTASLPSSIGLAVEIDPDAGVVPLSSANAQQIVLNLGTNAMHAMPDGGTLRLRLGAGCECPGGALRDGGDHVCLTVEDTGTGMDETTRERALEPFFTTKPPGRGTGLGLATVHGMVQAAGGTLQIESTPGAGTTIRVHLPRISAPDHAGSDSVHARQQA